jgi:putative FmdB family regulatory protein
MPIFEYECRACGHEFELLVRSGDVPACPSCQSEELEKLLSLSSISTPASRQANIAKAREAAKPIQRDRAEAEADEIREHYGPDALKPIKTAPKPFRRKV